ncbi:MAG: hypothetical protein E6J13_12580 [Chloroflexi bacterium]|nr:MAG: hypothetical protein E6J13_12580 [Chloroflexota bacterium]
MKRALIGLVAVFGFTLGTALPASAGIETPIRIDCSDGDSIDLTVDLDTLTALTSSVAAINQSDTDLTCTLVQVSAPLPVVTFGSVAAAATSGGYVIGAGTVEVGCPPDFSTTFVGSFSVKMHTKNGTLRGSANLSVPSGACVPAGKLYSKPTCLVISPTTLGGGRAWANSFVTSTSGSYFASELGKTIGWGFEDNGPNGGTLTKDRWRVEEKPGSCPVPGDPRPDEFYTVMTGDLTVRP